jgi:DmsE family decaheme c-type cytochrome
MSRSIGPAKLASIYLALAALCALLSTSCRSTTTPSHPDEQRLDKGWPKSKGPPPRATYPVMQVSVPRVEGATYVNEEALCKVCHSVHVETFQENVHRQHTCEACHGPASRHLETRGQEPGLIRSFSRMKKAERSEVCAQCHEQDGCAPGAVWRTSAHAHHGVACTDCHMKIHYNVPPGTPAAVPDLSLLHELETWVRLVSSRTPAQRDAEGNVLQQPADRKDLPSLRGTTNNLGAVVPYVCYSCHGDKYDLEAVAHPHQVQGPHDFNCQTCHNPHGNVLPSTRKELCLQCHTSSPTQAWHSSIHDQVGVMCTDCHNPHPNSSVQPLVDISHYSVQRPKRLPMSVDDPNVCYKCHQEVFALTQLPSHHPIREGKMVCKDCHDPHGQAQGHLNGDTVNLTCYKCHADKQGPFVYQHAPVEENCSICHNPHGTVANNLLHQPTTFLCLRCHSGHRAAPTEHFGIGTSDIDNLTWQQPVLYTDCTQCHAQIHGSDLPSQNRSGTFLR